jgi:hypothetical protein
MVLHDEAETKDTDASADADTEAVTSLLSFGSEGRPTFFVSSFSERLKEFSWVSLYLSKNWVLMSLEVQADICFVCREQCFDNQDMTAIGKMFVVNGIERKGSDG